MLPLKAVLLNLVSVAATLGLMVLFWQHGFGSNAIFGINATGDHVLDPGDGLRVPVRAVDDYEVFILSRIREEYDGARSTNAAVIEGIGRTGRLVTSAALILFLAFAALASGPGADLKVLATGLCFGILLDATIVRSLLVPSLVSLFGRWNWYVPARFGGRLRVQPVPPTSRGRAPGGDSGRLMTAGLVVRCIIATIARVPLTRPSTRSRGRPSSPKMLPLTKASMKSWGSAQNSMVPVTAVTVYRRSAAPRPRPDR